MSKDQVVITEIPLDDEHLSQKWVVLEGSFPGTPEVTKRVTVNSFALASGRIDIEEVEDKLRDTVVEYKARWDAVRAFRENRPHPKPPKPQRG